MEAMQHESVNKLWTGDNGGILRCWDVLLASLRSHLDCLIVWFFGRVFFFFMAWEFQPAGCILTGECQWKRSCLWFQQWGAPISPCIHGIHWPSTHWPRKKSLRPVSRLALGAGFMARTWSYGVIPSEIWKLLFFFHDFVDGKLGNSLHKRCAPTPVEWALLTPKQVQLTRQWCAK